MLVNHTQFNAPNLLTHLIPIRDISALAQVLQRYSTTRRHAMKRLTYFIKKFFWGEKNAQPAIKIVIYSDGIQPVQHTRRLTEFSADL